MGMGEIQDRAVEGEHVHMAMVGVASTTSVSTKSKVNAQNIIFVYKVNCLS